VIYLYMSYEDGTPNELDNGGELKFRIRSSKDHSVNPRKTGGHNWYMTKRIDCWFVDKNGFNWHGVLITGGMNDRVRCVRSTHDTEIVLLRYSHAHRVGNISPELDKPYLRWRDMESFMPFMPKNLRAENFVTEKQAEPKQSYSNLAPYWRGKKLYIYDGIDTSAFRLFNPPIVQSNVIEIEKNLIAVRTRWWCKENPSSRVWFFMKTKTGWKGVPYNQKVRNMLEIKLATQILTGGTE
jgi:hypothetical protein